MIAFIASTKVKVNGLILCSLSPYFKEDLSKLKDRWISPVMMQDFSSLHCIILAKRIKAKQIHMLYGTKETSLLISRVYQAYNQISSVNKYLKGKN
ncbi:MAG: hypothetical protein M1268_02125 [Patescibacteria group bacterium]|nr:hypothetical protein [Patescibacteria group bacterium]